MTVLLRLLLLAASLLLLASAVRGAGVEAGASRDPRAGARFVPFGRTLTYNDCLLFTADRYVERQEAVFHHDWVTITLRNRCDVRVRHLQVALILEDPRGEHFGTRLWILKRGEVLPPGGDYAQRYAVPDPDRRIARRWTLRVLRVERAAGRR